MNPLLALKNKVGPHRRRFTESITGKTPLPGFVSLELNYDCPSKCLSVIYRTPEFRAARIGKREKLSIAQWKSIIRGLSRTGSAICNGSAEANPSLIREYLKFSRS